MPQINLKRVILGGLLAGLIINISETILNVPVMGDQMAEALKLSDGRAVRYYESGEREISGPIQIAIAYMLKHGLPRP